MERVETIHHHGTSIIAYDNPPRRLLTAKGTALLLEAVKSAMANDAVQVIVLTGTEDVFIRHYDVEQILSVSDALSSGKIDEDDLGKAPLDLLAELLENGPKPVIAAINGICMGGGFELALMCDIRVASRSVEAIGLPETRLNIIPGGGGTQRLPKLIGEAAALNFILRGQVADAEGALALGLVTEIAEDALERALQIGDELTGRSAACLRAAKQLVRGAVERPLSDGLAEEKRQFLSVIRDKSAISRMQEFCDSPDQDILG